MPFKQGPNPFDSYINGLISSIAKAGGWAEPTEDVERVYDPNKGKYVEKRTGRTRINLGTSEESFLRGRGMSFTVEEGPNETLIRDSSFMYQGEIGEVGVGSVAQIEGTGKHVITGMEAFARRVVRSIGMYQEEERVSGTAGPRTTIAQQMSALDAGLITGFTRSAMWFSKQDPENQLRSMAYAYGFTKAPGLQSRDEPLAYQKLGNLAMADPGLRRVAGGWAFRPEADIERWVVPESIGYAGAGGGVYGLETKWKSQAALLGGRRNNTELVRRDAHSYEMVPVESGTRYRQANLTALPGEQPIRSLVLDSILYGSKSVPGMSGTGYLRIPKTLQRKGMSLSSSYTGEELLYEGTGLSSESLFREGKLIFDITQAPSEQILRTGTRHVVGRNIATETEIGFMSGQAPQAIYGYQLSVPMHWFSGVERKTSQSLMGSWIEEHSKALASANITSIVASRSGEVQLNALVRRFENMGLKGGAIKSSAGLTTGNLGITSLAGDFLPANFMGESKYPSHVMYQRMQGMSNVEQQELLKYVFPERKAEVSSYYKGLAKKGVPSMHGISTAVYGESDPIKLITDITSKILNTESRVPYSQFTDEEKALQQEHIRRFGIGRVRGSIPGELYTGENADALRKMMDDADEAYGLERGTTQKSVAWEPVTSGKGKNKETFYRPRFDNVEGIYARSMAINVTGEGAGRGSAGPLEHMVAAGYMGAGEQEDALYGFYFNNKDRIAGATPQQRALMQMLEARYSTQSQRVYSRPDDNAINIVDMDLPGGYDKENRLLSAKRMTSLIAGKRALGDEEFIDATEKEIEDMFGKGSGSWILSGARSSVALIGPSTARTLGHSKFEEDATGQQQKVDVTNVARGWRTLVGEMTDAEMDVTAPLAGLRGRFINYASTFSLRGDRQPFGIDVLLKSFSGTFGRYGVTPLLRPGEVYLPEETIRRNYLIATGGQSLGGMKEARRYSAYQDSLARTFALTQRSPNPAPGAPGLPGSQYMASILTARSGRRGRMIDQMIRETGATPYNYYTSSLDSAMQGDADLDPLMVLPLIYGKGGKWITPTDYNPTQEEIEGRAGEILSARSSTAPIGKGQLMKIAEKELVVEKQSKAYGEALSHILSGRTPEEQEKTASAIFSSMSSSDRVEYFPLYESVMRFAKYASGQVGNRVAEMAWSEFGSASLLSGGKFDTMLRERNKSYGIDRGSAYNTYIRRPMAASAIMPVAYEPSVLSGLITRMALPFQQSIDEKKRALTYMENLTGNAYLKAPRSGPGVVFGYTENDASGKPTYLGWSGHDWNPLKYESEGTFVASAISEMLSSGMSPKDVAGYTMDPSTDYEGKPLPQRRAGLLQDPDIAAAQETKMTRLGALLGETGGDIDKVKALVSQGHFGLDSYLGAQVISRIAGYLINNPEEKLGIDAAIQQARRPLKFGSKNFRDTGELLRHAESSNMLYDVLTKDVEGGSGTFMRTEGLLRYLGRESDAGRIGMPIPQLMLSVFGKAAGISMQGGGAVVDDLAGVRGPLTSERAEAIIRKTRERTVAESLKFWGEEDTRLQASSIGSLADAFRSISGREGRAIEDPYHSALIAGAARALGAPVLRSEGMRYATSTHDLGEVFGEVSPHAKLGNTFEEELAKHLSGERGLYHFTPRNKGERAPVMRLTDSEGKERDVSGIPDFVRMQYDAGSGELTLSFPDAKMLSTVEGVAGAKGAVGKIAYRAQQAAYVAGFGKTWEELDPTQREYIKEHLPQEASSVWQKASKVIANVGEFFVGTKALVDDFDKGTLRKIKMGGNVHTINIGEEEMRANIEEMRSLLPLAAKASGMMAPIGAWSLLESVAEEVTRSPQNYPEGFHKLLSAHKASITTEKGRVAKEVIGGGLSENLYLAGSKSRFGALPTATPNDIVQYGASAALVAWLAGGTGEGANYLPMLANFGTRESSLTTLIANTFARDPSKRPPQAAAPPPPPPPIVPPVPPGGIPPSGPSGSSTSSPQEPGGGGQSDLSQLISRIDSLLDIMAPKEKARGGWGRAAGRLSADDLDYLAKTLSSSAPVIAEHASILEEIPARMAELTGNEAYKTMGLEETIQHVSAIGGDDSAALGRLLKSKKYLRASTALKRVSETASTLLKAGWFDTAQQQAAAAIVAGGGDLLTGEARAEFEKATELRRHGEAFTVSRQYSKTAAMAGLDPDEIIRKQHEAGLIKIQKAYSAATMEMERHADVVATTTNKRERARSARAMAQNLVRYQIQGLEGELEVAELEAIDAGQGTPEQFKAEAKAQEVKRKIAQARIEQVTGGEGEGRNIGSFFRALLGGFGLMYLRSIGGIIASGVSGGYEESIKYNELAGQAASSYFGAVIPRANPDTYMSRMQFLGGSTGMSALKTLVGDMYANAPALAGIVDATKAGIGAFGATAWMGMLAGGGFGAMLSSAAPFIGGGVMIGSTVVNAAAANKDWQGSLVRVVSREISGDNLTYNPIAWSGVDTIAAKRYEDANRGLSALGIRLFEGEDKEIDERDPAAIERATEKMDERSLAMLLATMPFGGGADEQRIRSKMRTGSDWGFLDPAGYAVGKIYQKAIEGDPEAREKAKIGVALSALSMGAPLDRVKAVFGLSGEEMSTLTPLLSSAMIGLKEYKWATPEGLAAAGPYMALANQYARSEEDIIRPLTPAFSSVVAGLMSKIDYIGTARTALSVSGLSASDQFPLIEGYRRYLVENATDAYELSLQTAGAQRLQKLGVYAEPEKEEVETVDPYSKILRAFGLISERGYTLLAMRQKVYEAKLRHGIESNEPYVFSYVGREYTDTEFADFTEHATAELARYGSADQWRQQMYSFGYPKDRVDELSAERDILTSPVIATYWAGKEQTAFQITQAAYGRGLIRADNIMQFQETMAGFNPQMQQMYARAIQGDWYSRAFMNRLQPGFMRLPYGPVDTFQFGPMRGFPTGQQFGANSFMYKGNFISPFAPMNIAGYGDINAIAQNGVTTDSGMQLGGMAAINYAAQMSSFDFQMASLGISMRQIALQEKYQPKFFNIQQKMMNLNFMQQREQFQLQGMQLEMQERFFLENMGLQRRQMDTQRVWAKEDWTYNQEMRSMQWGWKQEDFAENIRFMSGRERRLAERQMRRETIVHDKETEQIERQKERQVELWRMEDERFEIQKKQQEESLELQQKQYELSMEIFKKSVSLQEQQFVMQKKYWAEQIDLQKDAIGIQAGAIEQQREIADNMAAYNQFAQNIVAAMNLVQVLGEDGQEKLETINTKSIPEWLGATEDMIGGVKDFALWIYSLVGKGGGPPPSTSQDPSPNSSVEGIPHWEFEDEEGVPDPGTRGSGGNEGETPPPKGRKKTTGTTYTTTAFADPWTTAMLGASVNIGGGPENNITVKVFIGNESIEDYVRAVVKEEIGG